MIWNFKIRHNRFSKFFNLYIFAVIFSDRHAWINDIRNCHHDLFDLFCQLCLFLFQFSKALRPLCYFCFQSFGFFFFALCHQTADIFRDFLSLRTQLVRFLLCRAALFIQCDHFIYKRKFAVLKFIFDILFYNIRIFP